MKFQRKTLWLVAAVLTGCAATPAEPEATVSPVEVVVSEQLPPPRIHTRDHKGGKRALHAVGGALGGAGISLYVGCAAMPIVGCLIGAMVAPVGALVGAAVKAGKVDSIDSYHDVDSAPGTGQLFTAAAEAEVPAALRRAVVAHALEGGGQLELKVRTFELSGEVGADANVALVMRVDLTLRRPGAEEVLGDYTYTSSSRRVSAWNANDARFFRQEIAAAVRDIAAHLAQDVRARTPSA